MSIIVFELICVAILNRSVVLATRTPEEAQIPLRWWAWHTFLASLTSAALAVGVAVLIWLSTGVMLPFWLILITANAVAVGWKLRKHRHRIRERTALQALLDP
jgi:Flp pilus assembly protein TadB